MYEVFTRKVSRSGSPKMSFSKIGQITFNQTAAKLLQKETVEHVLLLWDADERKVAIKTTSNKKDQRAYHLRFAGRGNGASFSAKTFMDHIGLDYSERRGVPIEIKPDSEMIIEVKLPETYFKRRGGLQVRAVGKVG